MTSSALDAKAALRRLARARRAAAHDAVGDHAPVSIARNLLGALRLSPGTVVAGYVAIRDEIDPLPALASLISARCTVALPVVEGAARPLTFRAWAMGEPLSPGAFSVMSPSAEAPAAHPDVVLTPMLAFDRSGARMGYGGGFYDRTLESLRRQRPIIAVGLAYADQEVDCVPTDIYDQPLDWIVTERFAIRCPGR